MKRVSNHRNSHQNEYTYQHAQKMNRGLLRRMLRTEKLESRQLLAADLLLQESFEAPASDASSNYALSAEFDDGSFDFFGRYAAPDTSNGARDDFSVGFDGSFAIFGQDHDGDAPNLATQRITIAGVDIVDKSDLNTTIAFAALASEGAGFDNYEAADSDGIEIYATIDAGVRTLVGKFSPPAEGAGASTAGAGDLYVDTDFDGVGDGDRLTTELVAYNFLIPGTGSALTLEIDLTSTGSFEPLVVDNVRVFSGEVTAPEFSIAASDASKAEGDSGTTDFTFVVTRGGDTSAADTVDYAVTGSATDGADATDFDGGSFPSGTVAFAVGETSQTVTIPVAGDENDEPNEGFVVTLSNPSRSGTLSTETAEGSILNDDATTPNVWINEFHYDNDGSDVNEFVEVAGAAGSDLSNLEIVLYNGNGGGSYSTTGLSGTIDDEGAGFGAVSFAISGIQNGAPDGIALVFNGATVIEFLSYEGSFDATNGPANGMTSVDVGVSEGGTDPAGSSLQIDNSTPGTPGVWGGPLPESPGTLNSTPAPTIGIIAADSNKDEGDSGTTEFTFTVTRTGDTSGANDVDFTVAGSGADAATADDFEGGAFATGTVSFAVGETSQTITVLVAGDTDQEADEGFSVTLSNPTNGATLGDDIAEGLIVNDDNVVPQFQIDGSPTLAEGDSGNATFTFTVTRSALTTGADTVDFAVTGTAIDGADAADFGGSLPSGTVTFANGEITQQIEIQVTGDTDVEPNEGFIVTLSNPSRSGTITPPGTALGTILDDDSPIPAVWINEIHYDNDGADTGEAVEIAGPAGTDLSLFTLYFYNGNGGLVYSVQGLTGTIDDEGSGVGAVNFPTSSSIQNGGPDGIALVYNMVSVAEFISYEGSFEATGGPAVGLTSTDIGVSEQSTTPAGQSLQRDNSVPATPGSWFGPATATPDVLNGATPSLAIAAVDASKDEGDSGTTDFTFSVTRSGDTSTALSVDYAVAGATSDAADAADFDGGAFPSGSVSFAAGETTQTITISVAGDVNDEPNEGFEVTLSNATAGAAITAAVASGTILNDDTPADNFKLQLLHASDLEGGVDAVDRAANFAAIVEALEADAAAGGFGSILLSAGDNYIPGPFFNASGDRSAFRDSGVLNDTYNTLFGTTEYDSLREGGGRVDISIMNILGFDASAVGNHEFDQGSDAFESIIEEDFRSPNGPAGDRWVGAQFPYLSANIDFSGDADLANLFTPDILPSSAFASGPAESLAGNTSIPKLAPATQILVGGEWVGVVGATTPLLETISSPSSTMIGPTTNDMVALAAVLQPVIDDLLDGDDDVAGNADDINKVILVSHLQQIALEEALIGLLEGVDIVVAGGSDTLLADDTDTLRSGDTRDGTYPLLTTNKDGDAAAIVSTDGEYSYVGRLVVEFDAAGILQTSSIEEAVSVAFATDDVGLLAVTGAPDVATAIADSAKATEVKKLTDAVSNVVTSKDGNILGRTGVFIEGRRTAVRTQETNMGNLTADANLLMARSVDSSVQVSLKNGGGIRAEIGSIDGLTGELGPTTANPISGKVGGEVSQLDVENTLRFNNSLSLLTLTAEELWYVLEHGVAASGAGATPGQFPQVSGLSFSFDPARQAIAIDGSGNVTTAGERIRNLAITDELGNVADIIVKEGVLQGDASREIRIVTLNFLAGGGDSYPFDVFGEARIDLPDLALPDGLSTFATAGTEQDALAEYMLGLHGTVPFYTQDTPASQDLRIQDVTVRSDTVLNEVATQELATNVISTIGSGDGVVGAEISAFDPTSDRLFVTAGDGLQVVDFSDPSSPVITGIIDPTVDGATASDVTSVAVGTGVNAGVVAIAVPGADEQMPGNVFFYNAATSAFLGSVGVGALPDMVTFTPDGTKLLVANEGEPSDTSDPAGSVSIISLDTGVAGATVQTVGFTSFDGTEDALRAQGVRIFPGRSVSADVEPEYITISDDSTTAFVALQEANAVAVLNLTTNQFTSILPLGLKDHTLPANALDPSNEDGGVNLGNYPVLGMYMPDAIASYDFDGTTYIVTANEGDGRDFDEERADSDLPKDPTAFPFATALEAEEVLGRIKASNINGDTDGDGDFDEIHVFGGRSFSIWDAAGNQVFDSGNFFERFTAAAGNLPDNRSDDKGPEPEGVTIASVGGETYAFVGLERSHDVMIFNVTDPSDVLFVDNISVPGDLEPEGLTFIAAADSPNGVDLLVITNEDSNTITTVALAPKLTVTISPESIQEGGTATATVTREGDTSAELVVTLNSTDTTEATVPATVTIPSGQASATFTVTGVQETDVDGTQTSDIEVSAAGLVGSSIEVVVLDDDDSIVPTVEGIEINDGENQRSQITGLTVTFNTQVTLGAGAFSLLNRDTGEQLQASQINVTPVPGTNQYRLDFGAGTSVDSRGAMAASLADGNYLLVVNSSQVTSSTATAMAADVAFGDDFTDDFFRLYGDSDGDGDVDGTDYVNVRRAFVQYDPALDANGDGIIDNTDLLGAFIANYGKKRRVF